MRDPLPGAAAFDLTLDEIRAVTAFAVACAEPALVLVPDDPRPRAAVDAAAAFARGGARGTLLRDVAWAAHRAAREARDAGRAAAGEAARAAGHAAGAAYLHPLANATQVGHVVGAAAYAARAFELDGHPDGHLERCRALATPVVVDVLRRYPPAPPGHARPGELMRALDAALRLSGPAAR